MAGELKTSEEVQIFQKFTKIFAQNSYPVSHNALQIVKKKHGGKHNGGIWLQKNQLKFLKSNILTRRPQISLDPLLNIFYQA